MIVTRRLDTGAPGLKCEHDVANFYRIAKNVPIWDHETICGHFEMTEDEWVLVCRGRWTPRKKKGESDVRRDKQ